MMKWSIVIGPEPVNIFQSRPADGPLTSRFALLWNNYLFQIVLHRPPKSFFGNVWPWRRRVLLSRRNTDKRTVAHNCHGKSKLLAAKANYWRQKQIAHGKSNLLTAKPNRSRQNQIAHGKSKFAHGKTKSVHRKDLGTRLERARCMVAVEDVLSELWVLYAQRGSEVLYPMWYR